MDSTFFFLVSFLCTGIFLLLYVSFLLNEKNESRQAEIEALEYSNFMLIDQAKATNKKALEEAKEQWTGIMMNPVEAKVLANPLSSAPLMNFNEQKPEPYGWMDEEKKDEKDTDMDWAMLFNSF